jgi:GAF domain-containing protein
MAHPVDESTVNPWQEYYHALYEVATALGQSLDPRVVLQQLVEGVVRALGLKAASIRLLQPGGILERVAAYGHSPNYIAKGTVELARSPIDREAIAHGPVQIADVRTDERFEYPEAARQEGIVSAVFVPLIARGEPIGVLRAYTGQERIFHPDEIQLLTALANLGALAIANARLYQVCIQDQRLTAEALWNFRLPNDWLK